MKKLIADRDIPKNIGSRPKGKSNLVTIKINVDNPPVIIENIAANVEGLLNIIIPRTGKNNPETMKAYECSIRSKTLCIKVAKIIAKIPINRVAN